MKRIKVHITAIDPLVITSSSGDSVLTPSANYISGTMLRGIIAGEFIKARNLGIEAHKDEEFRKLFFGGLNYINAMPVHDEQVAFPVPLSLMKHKITGEVQDLLLQGDPKPGFKNIRGLAIMDDSKLCGTSVDKNMSFHMSRSSEDERIAGRSVDGQVFNYEAIVPGQAFSGEIVGEAGELQALLNAMPEKNFYGRIGRSRFTQYGTVKIQLGEIEDISVAVAPKDNKVFIYALSPIIPLSGNISSAENALNDMLSDIMSDVHVTDIFASVVQLDNFVNIWGMKRPRVQALAGGTIFALEKEQWTKDDIEYIEKVLYKGIGQRTQEGFGQLRIWHADVKSTGETVDCFVNGNGVDKLKSGLARNVVYSVVEKYILEQLKQFAYDDAASMKPYISMNRTHFFARMLQELGEMNSDEDKRLALANKVISNLAERKNSPYYKAMDEISVKHTKFKDLLGDTSSTMPYIEAWHNALKKQNGKLGELMEKIDMKLSDKDISHGKYFYTYWYWLFRYCRKLAATKKGDR